MRQSSRLLAATAVAATLAIGLTTTPAGAVTHHSSVAGIKRTRLTRALTSSPLNGVVDASAGLRVRSHAGKFTDVSFNDPVIGTYPVNTEVHIYCVFNGSAVTGPFGTTTLWDAVDIFQEPGQNVSAWGPAPPYAVSSDAWINTGTNNPIAPPCSSL